MTVPRLFTRRDCPVRGRHLTSKHDKEKKTDSASAERADTGDLKVTGNVFWLDYPIRIEALEQVLASLRAPVNGFREGGAADLIGGSEAIQTIRGMIARVAPKPATVLITGESGTGKEVVARRIHEQSGRDGPFVAINCSAIPDNLLESELFGHEKGAFTGAHAARAGKFEMANGGTIFLDEIGDMPLAMQVKLLRALQERVVERIGGDRPIPIDVRIIAATHRDLALRIESGEFREDLFYRLSVFPIEIPPLRERPEDVRPLIREMLNRVRAERRISVEFPEESIERLAEYAWPGNVRELANVVERLAVQNPFGKVELGDLPQAVQPLAEQSGGSAEPATGHDTSSEPGAGLDVKAHLGEVERQLIESALRRSDGVVARAAELLGVGRTTLVEKMRRYGIS